MQHGSQRGRRIEATARRWRRIWIALIAAIAAVALCLGAWFAIAGGWRGLGGAANPVAKPTSASADRSSATLRRVQTAPRPVEEHHGNSPDCPDRDCIALLVNGDLLFHPNLWKHFASANTAATDGTAFDFDPLFEPMKRYIQASDIAVCEFETPIAQRGGPYSGYPVFNIPPEVADAAKNVGYRACTHATNHSWDQGEAGVTRLWDTLEGLGIAQTGSYKTQEDSTKPMLVESPTGGGTLAVVTGTVSLNGMTADADWRVDRLRDFNEPEHQADIDKAVAKARAAREAGADVVAIAMHSVQEYLETADTWQINEAHALADTGAFDVIYGAGCHCVQPIENYNGTWIIYGTGNAVSVQSKLPGMEVNNQGITARIQFAGRKGDAGSWRVTRIDWVPHVSLRQGEYRWCPISSDRPDGPCMGDPEDETQRQRIGRIIYSMGADPGIVREWNITQETAQEPATGATGDES